MSTKRAQCFHYESLVELEKGCYDDDRCLAIGVFDGLHLGHQQILSSLVEFSRQLEVTPCLWTFSQHLPKPGFERIMDDEQLLIGLGSLGVEEMHRMDFSTIRELSAEDFLHQVLLPLKVKGLVLGEDSRLGYGRGTGAEAFARMAQAVGVETKICSLIGDENNWSSSRMRMSIKARDWETYQRCAGRAYAFVGTVVRDKGLAKILGFPTANIELTGRAHPPCGVYGVQVEVREPRAFVGRALAYIGARPTIGASERFVLEVHILDFEGDLYGTSIEVSKFKWIRNEETFEGLDALKNQIKQDIERVR